MANNVFANGREVSCKAGDGKSICAFPDVCFTPPDKVPPTPPGVPIPYPNTGVARDTSDGSKQVKISRKETMLKNRSFFKKSMGDEAGCATKKGVITSTNRGKVYFVAWSMDVKVEGQNVVRHLDLTTHNHASAPGQTPPWPELDAMAVANIPGCETQIKEVKEACDPPKEKAKCPDSSGLAAKKQAWRSLGGKAKAKAYADLKSEYISYSKEVDKSDCHRKLKCILVPKNNNETPPTGCCPHQTPDHIIDGASLRGMAGYNYDAAPCVCVSGHSASVGTHGIMSNARRLLIRKWNKVNKKSDWNFGAAKKVAARSVELVFPASKCDSGCIEAQLQSHHEKMMPGINDKTPIKQKASGKKRQGEGWGDWMKFQKSLLK